MFFSLDYTFRYWPETQLWYAHGNKDPSFDQYSSIAFGGWERPKMKQYQGTTDFCGGSVDFNYEE